MEYLKICIDDKIEDIFLELINYIKSGGKNILFYNKQDGKSLNKEKIFKIIYFLEKLKLDINYLFYNVPFCLFKSFGKQFINNHCIFNRLCNYYSGYIDSGKCNNCEFGLFCNNFNSLIKADKLEGFYGKQIDKDIFLKNFINIYSFLLGLGYSKENILITSRQKYFLDFLKGKEINSKFLQYLTLSIKLINKKLNYKYFLKQKNETAVFIDNNLNNDFFDLQRKYGINVLLEVYDEKIIKKEDKKIKVKFDNYEMYFYNSSFYLKLPPFFDFEYDSLFLDKNTTIFGGISKNKDLGVINGKANLVKNARDFLYNKTGNIYVGKDVFSGINIKKFDAILITSDASSQHTRLDEISSEVNIPMITNIKPNITECIENGSNLEINFKTGAIKLLK